MPPPPGLPGDPTLLDDEALAAHYAYPADLAAPFVRVNFVSSADGAVTVDGRSGGLGSDADHRVFGMLRQLADVVLVGAGTVRAENYRGARRPHPRAGRAAADRGGDRIGRPRPGQQAVHRHRGAADRAHPAHGPGGPARGAEPRPAPTWWRWTG